MFKSVSVSRWEVIFIAITNPFLEFISVWHTFMALEGGRIVPNCIDKILLIPFSLSPYKDVMFLSLGVFRLMAMLGVTHEVICT